MRKEVTTFFRALLFTELCCRKPCNWTYINLFLIGGWTTTSSRIYHQSFSATIFSWSGCKFGVFLNTGVRGTHGTQPSKNTFECMGDIAHYRLYSNKGALILGSGKVIWNMHRFKKIRSLNRLLKKDLWRNLLKESFKDEISPLDPSPLP